MFFTKQTIPIAGFFTICFLHTTDLLIADILNNTRCPVEPTEIAVAKYKSTYKGKTIYFCCKDCVTTFNDQPEPYLENINDSFTSKSS
ncbi:MAG: YHS domain-containing protein, partial [Verrucomicrobiota bacterium]|nr:YHS domain-containing protein [Verrucomicrobiota bacterium]